LYSKQFVSELSEFVHLSSFLNSLRKRLYYITLFRLTGQQSHNTQHNHTYSNTKKEKEDTVN